MPNSSLQLLNKAFSPSAPIQSMDLFLGRLAQLNATIDAINERGQHFVIYGERGVGKTSLANIISQNLANVTVAKVTCNRMENFKQVWEKSLSQITLTVDRNGIGFIPKSRTYPTQLDLLLPNTDEINSMDILDALKLVSTPLLLIFDEFDSIVDVKFRVAFADTIKNLSDNASNVTIGIVGIAENVESLIGAHPSLERCLKQIPMPRMSKDELGQIIEKGILMLGLSIDSTVRNKVVEYSSGFPHFTHLLMKHSAKRCLHENSSGINWRHLKDATNDAIEDSAQSLRDAYQKAVIAAKQKSKFEDVLGACALADVDEFGAFAIRNVCEPYFRVTGIRAAPQSLTYNIQKLCDDEKGAILTRVGESRNCRYTFTNPIMKAFVKLKLEQRGSYEQPHLFM